MLFRSIREGLITALARTVPARWHATGSRPAPMPLALFWTPYADWIYTVISTGGLLLVVWLVLRPRP